jgi:hypothetical protein
MSFTFLSSSKWPTRPTEKAQALDSNALGIARKRKNTDTGDQISSKKGKQPTSEGSATSTTGDINSIATTNSEPEAPHPLTSTTARDGPPTGESAIIIDDDGGEESVGTDVNQKKKKKDLGV